MNLAAALRSLRHVRHLRVAQVFAQARHVLLPEPVSPLAVRSDPGLAADTVAVPFLPPPAHCSARVRGNEIAIRLLGKEVAFLDAIDWEDDREGPLFAYHLHQFDYARAPGLPAESRLAWMLDWAEEHREGVGWDPHPISQRVLAWGKLLLTPGALPEDAAVAATYRSLATQVQTLSHNLEIRLQGNHLFSNLLAVVFGGLLLECDEADAWRARAAAFRAELRDQILPDGGHEERSPMYHALLLEQVLDLLNLARAVAGRAPDGLVDDLEEAAGRMSGALEVFAHPDGEIGLFSDAGLGIAQSPLVLAEYASQLGIAVRGPEQQGYLDRTGFVRLADGDWHLIASVAGPGPDHQPGHAHCDALSFELSVLGQRVVTDTGVFEYVPGPARDAARATRSHATVEVDGRDQAEVFAAHRVGGRPQVRVLEFEPGHAVEASCRSWSTRRIEHRRRFELSEDGLLVHDQIEGAPPGVPLRLTLPLAPGLRARLVGRDGEAQTLVVALDGGRGLRVALPGPALVAWRLEPADCFESFGRRRRRWTLVGESRAFRNGTWRFALAQPD